MKKKLLITSLALCCSVLYAQSTPKVMKTTGWFVDESCARGRVESGRIEPPNPECSKKCIAGGAKVMFLSQSDKALYEVSNPEKGKPEVGYLVEVSGTKENKALHVEAVKRISEVPNACDRPKLKQ